MTHTDWRSDWEAFVRAAVVRFQSGKSDAQISSEFAEQDVTWVGVVKKNCADNERPYVQLGMPRIEIELPRDRVGVVDFLNLNIDSKDDAEPWIDVPVGAKVRFRTWIIKGNGPFPGLRWSEFENEGTVLIGTKGSVLLEVLADG